LVPRKEKNKKRKEKRREKKMAGGANVTIEKTSIKNFVTLCSWKVYELKNLKWGTFDALKVFV
jgi:hypothetical protein